MKILKPGKLIFICLNALMIIILLLYAVSFFDIPLLTISELPFNKRFIPQETKIYGAGERNDFEKLIQSVKTNLLEFDIPSFKYKDTLQEDLSLASLVIYLEKNAASQFTIMDCELRFYLNPRKYKRTVFSSYRLYTGTLYVSCSFKDGAWYFLDRRTHDYCANMQYDDTFEEIITPQLFVSVSHINTVIEKISDHLNDSANTNLSACSIVIYSEKIEMTDIPGDGEVIEYSLKINNGEIVFAAAD